MQQEHKLSPSLSHHWGSVMCRSMATMKEIWSSGKTSHKNPNPIQPEQSPVGCVCIWTHPGLLDVLGRRWSRLRASGTQGRGCTLQSWSIDAPGAMGETQTSRWMCPFLGLWGTWRDSPVLPPPHHTHQMHLPLPHSFTLDNANMLLTWVAEKWAIKRNTWENRRDSTKIKEHVFSLPGWPSYSTNWQRNSNDEAGKQGGCQQQFHKGCLTSLFVLNPGNIKYSLFHKLLNPWLSVTIPSWNKLSISQQLQKDVIRLKSRGRQRKHSNTFSYITQTSACIIFVFIFVAAILY